MNQDKKNIHFWVEDTGVGIKDEDKPRLFNSFSKLECNSELNPHGAGLGLTISNSLVRLLNRTDEGIKFESEWGKGTKFWFKIPIRFVPSDVEGCEEQLLEPRVAEETENDDNRVLYYMTPKSSNRHVKSMSQSSYFLRNIEFKSQSFKLEKAKHILLVDDNPFNVLIAQQLIEKIGFKVACAYNGEEALKIAQDLYLEGDVVSLILMDCMMPIMNGYEATRKLREMMRKKELEHIPIVALSAGDDEQDIKNSLEAGMDEHMCKPLNEFELLRVLEKYKVA